MSRCNGPTIRAGGGREGAGPARAGLPAGTHGKTGTARYGSGSTLATHAWFTGSKGGLAFCVYVQEGASGGPVAAPVGCAARFLRRAHL